MPSFSFKILKKSKKSLARLGILETPHGRIETPAFAAIATQATVKSLSPNDLKNLGVQVALANTYHLHLRPGEEIIRKAGGLHNFMGWHGPIMTDSGGFQVFSLGSGREHKIAKIGFFPGKSPDCHCQSPTSPTSPICQSRALTTSNRVKIREQGVYFRSHIDGREEFLSPEKSIEIQRKLGADLIFAFDECTSPLSDKQYTKQAMERTHRWALRCLSSFRKQKTKQALFGIIQGGEYKDLREESAKFISSLPFDGIAVGGALGKTREDMFKILKWMAPILPEEKPRHLLGIGTPEDLSRCVKLGMDIFDCVWPTRLARRGTLLTKNGKINIKSPQWLKKFQPIEKKCSCNTCQNFTLSYLCHLERTKELLYHRLATIHNLHFTLELMRQIRRGIKNNKI